MASFELSYEGNIVVNCTIDGVRWPSNAIYVAYRVSFELSYLGKIVLNFTINGVLWPSNAVYLKVVMTFTTHGVV